MTLRRRARSLPQAPAQFWTDFLEPRAEDDHGSFPHNDVLGTAGSENTYD